jgi:Cu+-exporting ATPase
VAGFCFGNSMLISLPEYLDMDYQIPENFRSMFGYINMLFALPVFFYSATVYFQSAWKGLKHKFINIDVPISLGIITLFVRSMVEILWLDGTGFVDSLAGLVFFLLIGRWYQHKTYQALSFDRDFNSYFPVAVTKMMQGEEKLVKLEELKEGDQILIRNNELIPADAKLVDGSGNIDYSFVTGESIPSHQVEGDQLYAGGRQIGGPIIVELPRTVNNSHLTKLWNSDIMSDEEESAMNNVSDRISRYFTAAILIFAMFGAILWLNIDASKAVNVFTAILIVACPCALALSVPFSYGHTLRVFGKHGFYLKNANIIEKIAGISQIIFDKTGTLTKTLPEKVEYVGRTLSGYERSLVLSATANSIHPLSKILKQHMAGSGRLTIEDFSEISGKGIMAKIDGKDVRIGSRDWVAPEHQADSENTQVWLRIDGEVRGCFEFTNAYREGVFESLNSLRPAYGLHLLSGDKDGEKERLNPYFDNLSFNQSPQQKLDYTLGLKKDGKVMMVGDGLNDAGALKSSDVGISISDDVYQFSPACDAILDASKVNKFERFLKFSKTAVGIVYLAFAISFLYNIVGLTFAIMGQLTPLVSSILMPISSVTVVGFITLAINWKTSRIFR